MIEFLVSAGSREGNEWVGRGRVACTAPQLRGYVIHALIMGAI
jgi:hypothetical protein